MQQQTLPPEALSGIVHVEDEVVEALIVPMTTEPVTFITVEYHGRTFRFCVRGVIAPFEVSYQHEFEAPRDEAEEDAAAWFPIAPVRMDDEVTLQQYLRPQLVELHRLARR